MSVHIPLTFPYMDQDCGLCAIREIAVYKDRRTGGSNGIKDLYKPSKTKQPKKAMGDDIIFSTFTRQATATDDTSENCQ